MKNKIIFYFLVFMFFHNLSFAKNSLYEKIDLFGEVLENIQKDYVNCYSFYKVAAQSFKDAEKDKNIIDSLENSADVSLKYNYDLGEIMGLNPEVMSQMTKDNVDKFIKLAKKDFSLLAKDYGMMCKNLVENPEQRTNFWEEKGKKKFK